MKFRTYAVLGFLAFIFLITIYVIEIQKIVSVQPKSWSKDFSADCAVVLTGGRYRVQEGISLLSQKRIRKLIISGVNPESTLMEIFPQWIHFGVLDEQDVILEKYSKTTYGNAQQSLQLVEALQCRDIILVTSRLHMHRAHNTFEAVFPDSITILNNSVIPGHYDYGILELFIESTKSIFYSTWVY